LKEYGKSSSTEVSFTLSFLEIKKTGISAGQNSAITCLQAPQGLIGSSVSPNT